MRRDAAESTPEPNRLDLTQIARTNAALLRRIKTDPKPPTTQTEEDPK